MSRQLDVDQVLRSWLAEGAERAPERHVLSALEHVGSTPQRRRPGPIGTRISTMWSTMNQSPVVWGTALAAAAVVATALAFGSALVGDDTPSPTVAPEPSPTPSAQAAALRTFAPADSGVSFGYPDGWALAIERPFETWQYEGADPPGRMSISFGTPISLAFCPVECTDIRFDMPIPYSADRAAEIIAAQVSAVTGVADWEPLPESALPGLEAGRVQERRTADPEAGERREVVVVGVFAGRAVAFTWSQPINAFDVELMDEVTAAVFLDPGGPQYASGALMTHTDQIGGYELAIPDIWYGAVQPSIDGQPASGVRRFGERELTISVGDPDGTLSLCAATCRSVTAGTTLDTLQTAVAGWLPPIAAGATEARGETTVGGAPARFIHREVADDSGRRTYYAAYGLRDGRPVVLAFDVPSGIVTLAGIEEIVASFTFADAPPSGDATFSAPEGGFALSLPDELWREGSGPDPSALYLRRNQTQVALRWGDAAGRIQTCDEPAGPWEVCRVTTGTSLEELATAVAIEPVADHGVGPPVPTTDNTVLDDEPAMLIQIQAYEYPARGGQIVAYVIAMHDGRPLIIRFWTPADTLDGVDELLAGFRFED